ncbi:5'-3' exoribonuclease 1 [Nematocida sp. AWRm77]|nr:5'-3' exoribonuclease 1 [Nematocida sp. AWRm77]
MGIPRFFKMLTERYPLSMELHKETKDAGYDNFYIDMNGIIHIQTHDNNKSTKEELWVHYHQRVCKYMDSLVQLVKPSSLLFISVDGPVCRMKMNQQRSRRFLKTEEEQTAFDPNCISPGTAFMESLQNAMLVFIEEKRRTDPLWSKLTVVLSGHRVPGEGEHKIVSYIRNTQSSSVNRRHCIYGMDADLILLTLLTAMPHFSILREELDVRNKKTERFIFLHTHIIRDYIALETGFYKSKEGLLRAVDDIVFIMTLFGNDFLPGMFSLLDAFDDILVLYGRYIRVSKRHLHNRGEIDWYALERFLEEIVAYEKVHNVCKAMNIEHSAKQLSYKTNVSTLIKNKEMFYKEAETLLNKYTEKEFPPYVTKSIFLALRANSKTITHPTLKNILYQNGYKPVDLNNAKKKEEIAEYLKTLQKLPLLESLPFEKAVDAVWNLCRKMRYKSKNIQQSYAVDYLMSIEWLCKYYFQDSSSWSWYYPCHYSVFAIDVYTELQSIIKKTSTSSNATISEYLKAEKDYKEDAPVSPFVQLLSILSAKNKSLLPEPLQPVFSELSEYYPKTFATDKDGKKASWEAVCLIPFVDVSKITAEVEKRIGEVSAKDLVCNESDTVKVWFGYAEKKQEFPGEPTAAPGMYREISKYGAPFENLLYPSLFIKTVVPTMSRVQRSVFQQMERKRVVLKVMPCQKIMKEITLWIEASTDQPLRKSPDLKFFTGFPYLLPCHVTEIVYRKHAFSISPEGRIEKIQPTVAHAQALSGISKSLFKDKGIFIEDRASYAVYKLQDKELVVPLEMLMGLYHA